MSLKFRRQTNLFEAYDLAFEPPSFKEMWSLDIPFFEPPNHTRGGWSGVAQFTLSNMPVFIKRQENHVYRSIQHFFKNRPTFEREYQNILLLNQLGIPTYKLVYFGNLSTRQGFQTILITKSLIGYQALDDKTLDFIHLPRVEKQQISIALAKVLRQMHDHHIEHNCMYQKHIFIKKSQNSWDICLIDLEKAKKRWQRKKVVTRDLNTLYRTSQHISRSMMLRFYLDYANKRTLSAEDKVLIKSIIKKTK